MPRSTNFRTSNNISSWLLRLCQGGERLVEHFWGGGLNFGLHNFKRTLVLQHRNEWLTGISASQQGSFVTM